MYYFCTFSSFIGPDSYRGPGKRNIEYPAIANASALVVMQADL
ncbi:MAG TPA: hypothetical protein PLS00_03210 [Niabella sp.]|nr:hypothetical protein [Niabella sp.]